MPIYEYQCQKCKHISDFLILNRQEPLTPICPRCGGQEMVRIMSRFRARLSEETRMERLADPSRLGRLDENDPRSMAKFIKEMGHEMGEDISQDEVDQMVEEAMEAEGGDSAAGLDD
ncbi:MAG: zinc ribbon domain-containing protein [Deltaproteobacteria bacterium]|nr:zinc ribbon domain-containing protein [Deltaproteobacteria bacterium]MBW1953757.1 zinc ribbon domain-containing protein [Deltaproteobacteria bacterium]MBW1986921.1 zinc ribbon domain-containing protein [Deltaproteobacteria bacterium]MBW2134090.1 zinc ribbon domain-containing protein [Deltaproteobacteria bacterium]